jgi:hypothetical protein
MPSTVVRNVRGLRGLRVLVLLLCIEEEDVVAQVRLYLGARATLDHTDRHAAEFRVYFELVTQHSKLTRSRKT